MAQRITLAGRTERGIDRSTQGLLPHPNRIPRQRNPTCLPLGIHVLTPRELDVMTGRRAGLAYKQIAPKLGISIHTVKMHARHAFAKIGAQSSLQAVSILFS